MDSTGRAGFQRNNLQTPNNLSKEGEKKVNSSDAKPKETNERITSHNSLEESGYPDSLSTYQNYGQRAKIAQQSVQAPIQSGRKIDNKNSDQGKHKVVAGETRGIVSKPNYHYQTSKVSYGATPQKQATKDSEEEKCIVQ